MAAPIAALVATSAAPTANAQTVIEQAIEYRFQLDFRVNDAALQKMLPAGWEPNIAAMGPAKDCNLRMIFIDRVDVMGADGKPLPKGSTRLVYLAIPVKQSSGTARGADDHRRADRGCGRRAGRVRRLQARVDGDDGALRVFVGRHDAGRRELVVLGRRAAST